jgi:hypothetical protein
MRADLVAILRLISGFFRAALSDANLSIQNRFSRFFNLKVKKAAASVRGANCRVRHLADD